MKLHHKADFVVPNYAAQPPRLFRTISGNVEYETVFKMHLRNQRESTHELIEGVARSANGWRASVCVTHSAMKQQFHALQFPITMRCYSLVAPVGMHKPTTSNNGKSFNSTAVQIIPQVSLLRTCYRGAQVALLIDRTHVVTIMSASLGSSKY